VNGCIVFDDAFFGKPLVYCGTAGLMPAEILGEPSHTKSILPGDLVVMTGTHRQGRHPRGDILSEGAPRGLARLGRPDRGPHHQKKMTDFLLMARDRGLYRAITDNGAGGLSSSVGEMAGMSGGAELDLKKRPLKYAGLDPWEILLSEAQERMSLAIQPRRIDEFMELCPQDGGGGHHPWENFTDSGSSTSAMAERPWPASTWNSSTRACPRCGLRPGGSPRGNPEPAIPEPSDYGKALKEMFARLNICSKESVVRQYDHEVQGGSVVKRSWGRQTTDQAMRPSCGPCSNSYEGVVVANGICPR